MADPIEEEIQREIKANKILDLRQGHQNHAHVRVYRETMHFLKSTGIPMNSSTSYLSPPNARP